MTWTKGRGVLGPLNPLLGGWVTFSGAGQSEAAQMQCRRDFARFGDGWIGLEARWQAGPSATYCEQAFFGPGDDGTLACFSFTTDGRRSVGHLVDGSDVHPDAIAFEAAMPAGRARTLYWPLETGEAGFQFAAENKTEGGWSRFLLQHFTVADQ